MPAPSPSPASKEPSSISLDDVWEVIQARWRFLNIRQRCLAIVGSAFILTGGGLAFADVLTAGILFSLLVDFFLMGIGIGAFVWIAFQLKILTKGHVQQTRHTATRAALAAVQAIAPPEPVITSSAAPSMPSKTMESNNSESNG